VTVDEAARTLGLSVDAIRKRVQRGQIAYEKDPAGRVRIILDEGATLQDKSQDTTGLLQEIALLASKDETIRLLQEQLEQANERDRENRRIIAALTQRIPAIEAPAEPPETPESGAEEQQGRGPIPEAARPQEAGEHVSWWRRVFGGG
jgi:excisionase family DNA binding protein